MSLWEKLQEYFTSEQLPTEMYNLKGDDRARAYVTSPHRPGRYPVADAMLKVATLPFRPISNEEAEDPIIKAYLGEPNPMDKTGTMNAVTKMARVLRPEQVQAIRKTIEGMSGALTREEALRQLKRASEYETSAAPLIAKTPFETLKKYLRGYLNRTEDINPENKLTAASILDSSNLTNLDTLKVQKNKGDLIKNFEDAIGQRTPLHTSMDYPKLRETVKLESKLPIDDIDYQTIKSAEGPNFGIYNIIPKNKNNKSELGRFKFEVSKTPEGTFIKPTHSYKDINTEEKNVAGRVYKKAEEMFGGKIIPDEVQTPAGKALHLRQGFGREFGIPVGEVQPMEYADELSNKDNLQLIQDKIKQKYFKKD